MRFLSNTLNHNPVVRGIKNLRNEIVDGIFRRRKAAVSSLIDQLNGLGTKPVCFCIAYNTPWCIEVMIASWRRFVTGAQLVIIDNSSRADARAEIAALCSLSGVPYLALPKNPEWSLLRSHALAMNWIYYNIAVPLAPHIFGFLDHDCFPMRPFDLTEQFSANQFYGLKKTSPTHPERWSLWAGFCFFRYDSVRGLPLDFKHRVEHQLDTGGGNWKPLYGNSLPSDLREAVITMQSFPEIQIPDLFMTIENIFLHVGGASYVNLSGGMPLKNRILEALDAGRCG